ncbi:hypothetical protein HJC23_008254 [Cyclotella cryptica]|uniref:ABC transporter domain-containing protein n=1 Tax=Cyclotella cryptica TaxID=29204 RepID=A0ABD3Q6U1_9STRA
MITDIKSEVGQRRLEHAVDGLGIIETGLSSRSKTCKRSGTASGKSCRSADSKSLGTDDSTKVGRVILKKCEAKELRLAHRLRRISNCPDNAATRITRGGARKTLLYPMKVDIPAGCITAILGTSESGKSTLLKFMAGCADTNLDCDGVDTMFSHFSSEKGEVTSMCDEFISACSRILRFIPNNCTFRSPTSFERIVQSLNLFLFCFFHLFTSLGSSIVNLHGPSSYLPQDTNLHRFYTPRTYVKHYDRLLSSSFSGKAVSPSHPRFMSDKDIEGLLDSLRISHDRRDTVVGDAFRRGLTLGEKRRLELGLSVLSVPDTLFCENPFEGLDSETSLHIMEFLKGYSSNSSRRVIVTLNRPSNFIWNLIDNVILLSRGRVVFEGARFDMEGFFAHHGMSTPKRFSPIEHYLAVVNNFRRPTTAVNWEANFKEWQEEFNEDDGDEFGLDLETCFPSAIPEVNIPQRLVQGAFGGEKFACSKVACCAHNQQFRQLARRYLLQMLLNPGILQIRLAMYTLLSLFLGALFFNLEKDFEDNQSIDSHASLLFYSSSFYIFMVCATIPFLAIDLQIRNKEVLNGFYHPSIHHLAVSLSTIPASLFLSLVISVIQVNMVGLQNGLQFFLILTLALWCADALVILVSLCAPHFVIGIVVYAGICGLFMALEGFMLVPSKFPTWLRWTYPVPFHTYVFRSLMFNEFDGDTFGNEVLHMYEIEDTSVSHDMVVLLCYGLIIHLLCMLKIAFGHTQRITKRMAGA